MQADNRSAQVNVRLPIWSALGDTMSEVANEFEMVIETDRLILRRWQPSDVESFASLNADPRVMEFFPAMLSRSETEAMIAAIEKGISQYGFGFWAAT